MLTRHHLLSFVLLAACSGSDDGGGASGSEVPEEVALDVLIDDASGISIVAVYPLEEWRPLAAGGPVLLDYQLQGGGQVLASGQIADPRVINSETGGPVQLSFGVASLRLPASPGDLVFLEGASELGRVAFDPSQVRPQQEEDGGEEPAGAGIGVTRSPLLRKGDVKSRPTRLFGNLSKKAGVDLLILAEGYKSSQLGAFRGNAKSIARSFRSIMSRQRRYGGRFNIWVQDVRSRSSGIDDPRSGRRADTAFDVSFGTGNTRRCTWFTTADGEKAARALGRKAGADIVVVLANTGGYGGCANNGLFVITHDGEGPWVMAHELGHALLGLGDEYDYGTCSHDGHPNVGFSSRRARIPWGNSIGFATPLPTPENSEELRGDGQCDPCLGDDPDCDDGGGGGGGGGGCGDGTCAQDETDADCPADCGCAASSCGIAPFGCYCDPDCAASGDCCADACEACGSC